MELLYTLIIRSKIKCGDIMFCVPFFKVVVIKIDVFESVIVDERHFRTKEEARIYADTMQDAGYIVVIVNL
jgi:hypothetical protein